VTGATLVVCLVLFPQTTHLSSIFADSIKLPISLLDFALIAFVAASIGQEFWRGTSVRRKKSGSDPFTSLIGLALAKRRRYGGYIIHLGVAIMFLGFAGKAYEREDRHAFGKSVETLARETGKEPDKVRGDASVTVGAYTLTYERLIKTSTDHEDILSAQIAIYMDDTRISTVYPALHDYHRPGERPAKSPAIAPRYVPTDWSELGAGDIYVVLDGVGDPDHPDLADSAQFVVIQNPLILWVWAGILVLLFGTVWCLIPQSLVDYVQRHPPRTRIGHAADAGVLLAIVFGVIAGIASQAHAAGPAGTEHGPAAGHGMGASTVGWSTKYLPGDNATAKKMMQELLCPCGCARQDIMACECETAALMRQQVLDRLAKFDLSSDDGRDRAYDAVIASFVQQYGGEQVLATPRSKITWLFPSIAAIGALGLLIVVGRKWMRRGPQAVPASTVAASTATDDKYADKLDDELDDTDD